MPADTDAFTHRSASAVASMLTCEELDEGSYFHQLLMAKPVLHELGTFIHANSAHPN